MSDELGRALACGANCGRSKTYPFPLCRQCIRQVLLKLAELEPESRYGKAIKGHYNP